MPIEERSNLTERLRKNWSIESGHYVGIINDVNEKVLEDGRIPIVWNISLLENGRTIEKYHWVDKEGGVNLLVNDLRSIGANVNPESAVQDCNNMIGARILISIQYNGEHQNVTFLRRIK
jgi:hypothetical protein